MTTETKVYCDCGSIMNTDCGIQITGLEAYTPKYRHNGMSVGFRGQNTKYVCPKCGKKNEIYTGFRFHQPWYDQNERKWRVENDND